MSDEPKPKGPVLCGYIDYYPGCMDMQYSSMTIWQTPPAGEMPAGTVRIYVEIPIPIEAVADCGVVGSARIRNVTADPPKSIIT